MVHEGSADTAGSNHGLQRIAARVRFGINVNGHSWAARAEGSR